MKRGKSLRKGIRPVFIAKDRTTPPGLKASEQGKRNRQLFQSLRTLEKVN